MKRKLPKPRSPKPRKSPVALKRPARTSRVSSSAKLKAKSKRPPIPAGVAIEPAEPTKPIDEPKPVPGPARPWWGEGASPLDRWPDVTIEINATWNEANQRWESDNGKYFFDMQAADDACDFFPECLTHSTGEFANQPFILDEWQKLLVVRPIFGWKSSTTGFRRFRKVYIEIPKKNGKSKLCGGLGLFMTFCDGEEGAEVFVAAADRDQARIIFNDASVMVQDSPDLIERAEVFSRSIVYPETRSSFKVLSADVRGKHGPNVQCLIFDELHVQTDRDLFETLEKGIAARRQPLIVMITTSGDDLESICYEQREYAEGVMKEGGDDTFLPVLFTTPKELESRWAEPAIWARVNPGLGKTVKLEYLENEVVSALREPRKVNSFKRLHLNIWTQQKDLWIAVEDWDACKIHAPECVNRAEPMKCCGGGIELRDLKHLPFAMGLDLSSKTDLTALVLAFMLRDPADVEPTVVELSELPDGSFGVPDLTREERATKKKFKINFSVVLVPFYWMPEENLSDRKKKDRFGYDIMTEKGLLELTEGNIVDYDRIYEKIKFELAKDLPVKDAEIGYDPWNCTQLATQLQKDGFKTVEIPQTFRHMSEASKVFEALVKAKRIRHSGHRILRWNVENVAVVEDKDENIRPVKPSKMKRIDGVVASIDAINRLLVRKEKPAPAAFWIR